MKFLPHFDLSRKSFWKTLLVAVFLVSGPLYASEEELGVSGKISGISVAERFIEVNTIQYKVPLQAELQDVSSTVPKMVNIADLKVGQYVEFQAIGNIVKSLSAFEALPE